MRFKVNEVVKISIILMIIINCFIGLIKVSYVETSYIYIFVGLNLYVLAIIEDVKLNNYGTYTIRKRILNSKKLLFIGSNILISFYICKEPYFYLSKNKVLILVGGIAVEYFIMIFLYKIKIQLLLNFLYDIIKIFIISIVVYYLPIIFFV